MIVHVYSGMTSRLFTIADAIEVVRTYPGKKELVILWPIVNDCGIDIRDVLDNINCQDIDIIIESFKTARKQLKEIDISKSIWKSFAALIYNLYPIAYNFLYDNESKIIKKYAENKEKYDYNPPTEIGWEGEAFEAFRKRIWKEVKTRLQKDSDIYIHAYHDIIYETHEYSSLSAFVFKPEYLERVNQILGNVEKEDIVGVHIRRTDHTKCIKMSPLDLFMEKMDEMIEINFKICFFLATDDEDTQKELINKYGNRIIVQNKIWGRDSVDGMKSGIVDCLCLSRCNLVLGSCTSAFSDFSARYGGVELIQMKKRNSMGVNEK